jgi:hypothetical protein
MGKREGKRPPEDLSADGKIILKPTIKKQHGPGGGKDWFDLGKHRYKNGTLVNAVMNLQVPYNAVNSLTS